ncbi:MAG: hypothetical protein QNJ63_09045, partial [Calothrix sp. MO_192.B10]|nr:hypothetical protein [Calothrix sp. MO_192.B10]
MKVRRFERPVVQTSDYRGQPLALTGRLRQRGSQKSRIQKSKVINPIPYGLGKKLEKSASLRKNRPLPEITRFDVW